MCSTASASADRCTRLAVQHHRPVLRDLGQCLARDDPALGDQGRARDVDDLVLVLLADVDQREVLARVDHLLELDRRDRVAGRGVLRLVRHHAAEHVVVDQLGDLRRARVLADPHRPVGHLQGVVDHQPTQQRLADPGDQLDRLVHHDRADRRAQHAQHAALGARRNHAGGRRLGVEVAVVEPLPVRRVLPEHRRLALEPEDRAPHVRLAQQHGGVVDQVAGGEVVGAVQDQVVVPEDVEHVRRVEPHLVQPDLDERVGLLDGVARGLGLGTAHVGLAVDDLALEVRRVDDVELHDPQGAHTGGGKVEQGRAAEAACPDHEHLRVLEPLLPRHPDIGDDQVAAVALHLILGQLGGRLHERR